MRSAARKSLFASAGAHSACPGNPMRTQSKLRPASAPAWPGQVLGGEASAGGAGEAKEWRATPRFGRPRSLFSPTSALTFVFLFKLARQVALHKGSLACGVRVVERKDVSGWHVLFSKSGSMALCVLSALLSFAPPTALHSLSYPCHRRRLAPA